MANYWFTSIFRVVDNSSARRGTLVNSGVQVMLKFLYKILNKSWEVGNNLELCSELIEDGLHVIADVNKPLLYEDDDQLFNVTEELMMMIGKIVLMYVLFF